MSKILGLAVVLILAVVVMAWTRPTGPGPQAQRAGISPYDMHLKLNSAGVPVMQYDDRSVVFTER
jgi:hypothetical protein